VTRWDRDCIDHQKTGPGHLTLRGTGVHGSVAALRALPGLADDWGGFSKCSYFGGQDRHATGSPGCGAAGLAPVAVSPLSPLPIPFLCPDGFGRVPLSPFKF